MVLWLRFPHWYDELDKSLNTCNKLYKSSLGIITRHEKPALLPSRAQACSVHRIPSPKAVGCVRRRELYVHVIGGVEETTLSSREPTLEVHRRLRPK